MSDVKKNVDVRSQREESKCICVETNLSSEDEKQWSQDRSQNLKYAEKSITIMDIFFFFFNCKIVKKIKQ